METRLIIAYLLIGLLVAAAAFGARHLLLKRREHRRVRRGLGPYKRFASRR